MSGKIIKKYKKSGTYYRKLKNTQKNYEDYLKKLYSGTTEVREVPSSSKSIDTNNHMINLDLNSTIQQLSSSEGSVESCCYETSSIESEEEYLIDEDINDEETRDEEKDNKVISDTEESHDEEIKNEPHIESNICKVMQKWTIQYNIRHQALKTIISIIKAEYGDTKLPNDPRILLKTPKMTKKLCKIIPGGEYWHNGLENCLRNCFKNIKQNLILYLNFNIDGIPIHKSSKYQFWPIMCNIHKMQHIQPMPVGIYFGNSKPTDVKEYLTPFVDELLQLIENGIHMNGYKIMINVRCFICDSPARAFVKGVVNFNGKDGCQKCTTKGEYSHTAHKVIFPLTKCLPRTDEMFRLKKYGDHHKAQESPILKISGVDMVKDFIVADSLHLLELGVMKRCLMGWRDGTLGFAGKLCARDIDKISNKLLLTKLPSEIHRSMRSLDCLAFWKGVEYRTFLNYVGIVILKDILHVHVYKHFLLLFVATTICSCEIYSQHLPIAQHMFETYIEQFRDIYGENYLTSNIHNLVHVVEDVSRFGSLPSISAYPFENSLYQIKSLLRMGNHNLQQVVNRIRERNLIFTNSVGDLQKPLSTKVKRRGNNVHCQIGDGFHVSNIFKDAWFLTRESDIVKTITVLEKNNQIMILGQSIKDREEFFETPIYSSYLHIYLANIMKLEIPKYYSINNILCKLVAVNYKENMYVFIPLQHTLPN